MNGDDASVFLDELEYIPGYSSVSTYASAPFTLTRRLWPRSAFSLARPSSRASWCGNNRATAAALDNVHRTNHEGPCAALD